MNPFLILLLIYLALGLLVGFGFLFYALGEDVYRMAKGLPKDPKSGWNYNSQFTWWVIGLTVCPIVNLYVLYCLYALRVWVKQK